MTALISRNAGAMVGHCESIRPPAPKRCSSALSTPPLPVAGSTQWGMTMAGSALPQRIMQILKRRHESPGVVTTHRLRGAAQHQRRNHRHHRGAGDDTNALATVAAAAASSHAGRRRRQSGLRRHLRKTQPRTRHQPSTLTARRWPPRAAQPDSQRPDLQLCTASRTIRSSAARTGCGPTGSISMLGSKPHRRHRHHRCCCGSGPSLRIASSW